MRDDACRRRRASRAGSPGTRARLARLVARTSRERARRPPDDVLRALGERHAGGAAPRRKTLDERRRLAVEERLAGDGELAAHDAHAVADVADGEPCRGTARPSCTQRAITASLTRFAVVAYA